MKRTKMSGGENRSTIFRVRLTDKEKQLLQALSNQHGFKNVSQFLRNLITDTTPSSNLIDRQTLLLLHAELSKEGSNLNQYVRAINIRMKTGETINISPVLVTNTLSNVNYLTGQLLEILKNVRIRKS